MMKKLIAILLLGSLLILSLVGCNELGFPYASPTDNATQTTPAPFPGRSSELNEIFTMIESDKKQNDKISLYIDDEELHFELKNSGQYNNDNWVLDHFAVIVSCNYENAINEEWYNPTFQNDINSLNETFYNFYNFKGSFSNLSNFEGLHVVYQSINEFYTDYLIIKDLATSNYIKGVSVNYQYALPSEYILD